MNAPQIILIALYGLSLGGSIATHGKTRTVTENCVVTLVSTVIVFALLWWGGFFG